MLIAIDGNGSEREITSIPHRADYDRWRANLSDSEFEQITSAIEKLIAGREITVSSWLPGADWQNTPYWPIYDKACGRDFDASRQFFGLIVWQVMMEHEDTWSFGRYDIKGKPVEGMTYFRVER